jgi:hypothetical protein
MRRKCFTRGVKRRLLGAGAAFASIAIAGWASGAAAHAASKESGAADGSTVSAPPASVWAEYTEPPAPGSYLRVFDNPSAAAARPDASRGRDRPVDEPLLALEGAPEDPPARDGRDAPSDFPIDGLIVSFVLTALIGAAGGHIYAGIMGPKR